VTRFIAVTLVATAALIAVSMLGEASAEAPTSGTPPPRLVSVTGVARGPIAINAEQAAADAAYHQALTAAVEDGHAKAELLASDTGAKVGAVQSISEQGGSVRCQESGQATEYAQYVGYEGATPDFGSSEGSFNSAVAPAASAGKPAKRKKHARKASTAATCTVSARVSLGYLLE